MKGLHMRYLEYREQRAHGSEAFPVAFYHISPSHPRYNMPVSYTHLDVYKRQVY